MCRPESPRWLVKKGLIHEAAMAFSMSVDEPADYPKVSVHFKKNGRLHQFGAQSRFFQSNHAADCRYQLDHLLCDNGV